MPRLPSPLLSPPLLLLLILLLFLPPRDSLNQTLAGPKALIRKASSLTYPAELPAAAEGSKSVEDRRLSEACFMAKLEDSYANGLSGGSGGLS